MHTVFDYSLDQDLLERSLATSAFGSMWVDIPRPHYPRLPGAISCDLLVVGAGYAGLWSALHAAQRNPDAHIVLIDAGRVGWAASGRNGGFVDASLTHGAENGMARWPNEIDTLNAMGMENLDGMQADIEQLGLDVEWQRTGMLSVATEAHQVDWLREGADAGHGRLLDEQQIRDEVDSPTYLAGLFSPDTCAIVHPAKLALELARACRDADVQIFEHTNARSLDSDTGGLSVDTTGGPIGARRTVLATNVFPSLLRRNRLHTVPVYDYVLATSRSVTCNWTGSVGVAGRESATVPTNFTTTG